jgi:hypothetical protein
MARKLRLHLRYPASFGNVDLFVSKLSTVFNSYNVDITFDVATSQPVNDNILRPIDVGCITGLSMEAVDLFRTLAPAGMTDDEIAVLFPLRFTGAVQWGCAQCPIGSRGVLVSCLARPVTLPHEVAHLFLGPNHMDSVANLMYRDTDLITRDLPVLVPDQKRTLRAGNWALPAIGAPRLGVLSVEELKPRVAKPKARPSKKGGARGGPKHKTLKSKTKMIEGLKPRVAKPKARSSK